jgi:hypothetical protein
MKQHPATSNRKADLRMRVWLLRHVGCYLDEAQICTAWTLDGVGGCLEDVGVVVKPCRMFFRRGVEPVRRIGKPMLSG